MTDLFTIVTVLLAASLVVTLVLQRIGAPTLIGYIFVGLVIGPTGIGLLEASPQLKLLAEIGIVFLMFYVGLEFSLPVLLASRRVVFGLGGLQVLCTSMIVAGLALAAGVSFLAAVLLGGAVAMSSTAITIRQLTDQGELDTRHGRASVGTLLFQDLATLPFLVLVAALGVAGSGHDAVADAANYGLSAPVQSIAAIDSGVWNELGVRLGIAVLAFGAALVIGRRLLLSFVSLVHQTNSRELFMLVMLTIVIGAAWGAHEIGLSPPLGAFLAGMILGETRFKDDAESDIAPFRAVLLGLFFVSVGLRVDLSVIFQNAGLVVGFFAALVIGKGLIVFALARLLGEPSEVAARTGVILAHGGEFGLLILTLALSQSVIPEAVGQPLLGAIVISMIVAAFLIKANGRHF
ncbi:MAG: cation:proton antiporter [Erythrobacter sp.]|uniref:cation:proton antiporter domain-containing protein n=1 Tax=Erythrobacter sp. TaxID=1042 RepID=UPI001B20DA64|nr:cation:proton antiporter [Erythrobacter sp.]MBO6769702.1 cation:proton antiporter [Erythrobacter sp.]